MPMFAEIPQSLIEGCGRERRQAVPARNHQIAGIGPQFGHEAGAVAARRGGRQPPLASKPVGQSQDAAVDCTSRAVGAGLHHAVHHPGAGSPGCGADRGGRLDCPIGGNLFDESAQQALWPHDAPLQFHRQNCGGAGLHQAGQAPGIPPRCSRCVLQACSSSFTGVRFGQCGTRRPSKQPVPRRPLPASGTGSGGRDRRPAWFVRRFSTTLSGARHGSAPPTHVVFAAMRRLSADR